MDVDGVVGVLSVTFGLGQAERVALVQGSFLCFTQPHAWNPHALIDTQKHRTVISEDEPGLPDIKCTLINYMYSYNDTAVILLRAS